MTKILIIGAGRSASYLIKYLIEHSTAHNWKITVADVDIELARQKTSWHSNAEGISFDIRDEEKRKGTIKDHDLVVSMLPAFMHGDVARDCVEFGKHMATASYVSADMKALNDEAVKKNILLLNECGLDPGLDYASAMKIIHEIKAAGGNISSFKSFCGGLVAPQSNDNPWGYKFSWNPRNVILAGQGTAQYLENGQVKFIPYNRLYTQIDSIAIEGHNKFDAYANRDSIGYMNIYGLQSVKTMLRGTLREDGYCKAWNAFIRLGLTDDTSIITHASSLTYTSLIDAFLPAGKGTVKERLKKFLAKDWTDELDEKLESLEIFSDKKILLKEGTPAQLLQALLEEKWKLKEADKDMIVMQHQFEYTLKGEEKPRKLESSLVVIGQDQQYTAMALTVGLPLAITVKNFLTGKFKLSGVQIPIHEEIYEPMLKELEEHGVVFKEKAVN